MTTTERKTTVPPADGNGELDGANRVLKRCKKEIGELSPKFRDWVLKSLSEAFPAETKGE